MRTVEIKIFKFEELSEESQQKALEKLWDLNVDHDWWQFTYGDAEDIGLKLSGFDLYRHSIDGEIVYSARHTIDAILESHGEKCETYLLAHKYDKLVGVSEQNGYKYYSLYAQAEPGSRLEEIADNAHTYWENRLEELSSDFHKELLVEYLSILRREYEYLTSEEAIKECIEANEYEFTKNGELY